MFDNIYSHCYEGSNTTKATVDGADVRYTAMFVSTGDCCAVIFTVYHAGASEAVAHCGFGQGDRITQF